MSNCPHCSVAKGPAIKELRRDAFKEALALIQVTGLNYEFEDLMTLACFLIGLGEQDDDE